MNPELDRFKTAQASPVEGFEDALRELAAGRKRSHWIWYIFPQLAGLGRSPTAVQYGLHGVDEAMAYVQDPMLRSNLLAVTNVVAGHLRREPPPKLAELMGGQIDAMKLVSSMTLFQEVARRLFARDPRQPEYRALADAAGEVLREAERQGFARCAQTMSTLTAWERESGEAPSRGAGGR